MTEQGKDHPKDLSFYISQREEILNKIDVEKQKEKEAKEITEKQAKMLTDAIHYCHGIEKENESLQEKSIRDLQLRDEIVKKLIAAHELMNNNVKIFNLLQNVLQLHINEQEQLDGLKQTVLEDDINQENKMDAEENAYIKQLKDISDYIEDRNGQHLKNVENCDTVINNNKEEIVKMEQQIVELQNEITNVYQQDEKLKYDINVLIDEQKENSKKIVDLQTKHKELMEHKETEDIEHSKQIKDLLTISANNKDEILKLEKEFCDFENGLTFQTEFLVELKNQKITAQETLSNVQTTCIELEKEINNSEEQLQKECEEYENQINNLNKQVEELEQNKIIFEKENFVFEKELSEINNEENSLKTDINDLLTSSEDLRHDLKQREELLQDLFFKFENEIASFKKLLEEENQKEIINEEKEQELTAKYKKIDDEHKLVDLQNDAASAEAEADVITINTRIDSLKVRINEEKDQIQKKREEISKLQTIEKMKIDKLHKEFEEKNNEIMIEFMETKDTLNELYQNDTKIKNDELKKLKENQITYEFQISELKVCTQNLNKELELKINELDKLYEELRTKEKMYAELNNNLDTVKDNQGFKKLENEYIIPENKIPLSKYSSTSDSSFENLALLKPRRVSFKHRRTTQNKFVAPQRSLAQDSLKSIDDIFNSLKTGGGGRPCRERSNKK